MEANPAAGEHGLANLSGSAPDIGIVGYTTGGGFGWCARRYGLACNSVRAIELVTADGEQRRVDADNDPDLFWALRGGGGSFGVVTAIEFDLVELPEVFAGSVIYPADEAHERDRQPLLRVGGRACPTTSPRSSGSCACRRCRRSPSRCRTGP